MSFFSVHRGVVHGEAGSCDCRILDLARQFIAPLFLGLSFRDAIRVLGFALLKDRKTRRV
jgi:hypothetical protein